MTDNKGRVAKIYDVDHWLLPFSKRAYLIVDKDLRVVYENDAGFSLLKNQTETLIGEIDRRL